MRYIPNNGGVGTPGLEKVMQDKPIDDFEAAAAAVAAAENADRAIDPLEMRPLEDPRHRYWAGAAFWLGVIILITYWSGGAPHIAIPLAGLILVVMGVALVACDAIWRRFGRK